MHLMFIFTGDGSEPQDPAGAQVKTRQGAPGYQKIAGKLLLKSTIYCRSSRAVYAVAGNLFWALVFVAPSFLSLSLFSFSVLSFPLQGDFKICSSLFASVVLGKTLLAYRKPFLPL